MTRPSLILGICALSASFLILYCGGLLCALFLLFSAILLFILERRSKKTNHGILLALVLLLVAVRLVYAGESAKKTDAVLVGKTARISGFIHKTVYEGDKSYNYAVKIEQSSLPRAEGLVVSAIYVGEEILIPGDRIDADVTFLRLNDRERRFLLGSGYNHSVYINDCTILDGTSFTVWRGVHYIREAVGTAIDQNISGDEAAVMKALIIGDPSDISDKFNINIKNTGISHLIVVSGMHLGLLCGIVFALLQRRSSRPLHVFLGAVTVMFIAVVCLFQASILRASITYLIMLVSRYCLKSYDSLSSLGLGMFVTVLINPFIFFNAAFMLSVTATFSVIYPATMLARMVSFNRFGAFWGKIIEYPYSVLSVALCALFCTLPVVVYYFGYVPLVSPIVNLLVEMAMNTALVVGVAAVLIYFIPFIGGFLCLPVFEAARLLVTYFIWVINLLGKTGAGVVRIDNSAHFICFFITVLFVFLVKFLYEKNQRRKEKNGFVKRKKPEIVT